MPKNRTEEPLESVSSFRNNEAYRNDPWIGRLRRAGIILGALFFVSSSFVENILAPEPILRFLSLRLIIVLPCFVIALRLSLKPRITRFEAAIIAAIGPLAASAGLITLNHTSGAMIVVYPLGVGFAVLWTYLAAGVEYPVAAVYNLIVFIALFFFRISRTESDAALGWAVAFFLGGLSLLGLTAAILIQKSYRENRQSVLDLCRTRSELRRSLQKNRLSYLRLAHETRTPLSVLRAHFRRYSAEVQPSETLDLIRESLDRLERNMNHILATEKYRNPQEGLAPKTGFDLKTYLSRVLPLVEPNFDEQKLKLDWSLPEHNAIVAITDQDCRYITNNLLENAYRYTPEGGRITVSIRQLRNSQLELKVVNSTSADPSAGDRTARAENSAASRTDCPAEMSMGLNLIRSIVRERNGHFHIHRRSDGCVSARLVLPEADEIAAADTRLLPERPHLPRFRYSENCRNLQYVLIVADESDHLFRMVGEIREDYRVQTAADEQEALRKCRELGMPALVLSSVQTDGMDGYVLLRSFLESPEPSAPPVIVVSSDASEESRLQALGLGAVDFIASPFRTDILKMKIRAWMTLAVQRPPIGESDDRLRMIWIDRGLSEREAEVAVLAVRGMSRIRIGEKLFISENTVKSHLRSVYSSNWVYAVGMN